MDRYKVVEGSETNHYYAEYTIVDTTKPVIIGGERYKNMFEPVCEVFEEEDAYKIAEALNSKEGLG